MAKYILASDFYAHGVGHFKRSSGPFDWREIPDHIVVPKTAKRIDNAPAQPIEAPVTIPVLAGQKPQTVEDILRQRMALPTVDPRDERIKALQDKLEAMEKSAAAGQSKEPEQPSDQSGDKPDPAKVLASRDTNGRASGGKANK